MGVDRTICVGGGVDDETPVPAEDLVEPDEKIEEVSLIVGPELEREAEFETGSVILKLGESTLAEVPSFISFESENLCTGRSLSKLL